MSSFSKSNKISQVYTSMDDISRFKFKVIFKEIGNVLSIPRFDILSLENEDENKVQDCHDEKTFSWQQKIFSAFEINKYSDIKNCQSDDEKNYNRIILENSLDPKTHGSKLFSYVKDDPFVGEKSITTGENRHDDRIEKYFEKLHIKSQSDESGKLLSTDEPTTDETKTPEIEERMFIVMDMNNYENETDFTIKREHMLFSITWYPKSKNLVVYPDFNKIYEDPYVLETNYDSKRTFHYSIENIISEELDDAKRAELEIINKINLAKHEAMSQKMFKTFSLPPKNILTCYVIFGIISATNFEYDDLYIEYQLELPHGFSTTGETKGVTQISSKNRKGVANFCHYIELDLNYHIDLLEENEGVNCQTPEMYFEIISRDYWERHRTEGFCCVKIPLTRPGYHSETIQAIIPQSSDQRIWQMNRYFVGGRHTLKDISWIGLPSGLQSSKLSKLGIKSVPSGSLKVEMSILLQNRYLAAVKTDIEKTLADRVGAHSLFKSVNSVLMAYNQAREKLKMYQSQINE